MSRSKEKEKAIDLRKQGLSYSEILKKVPVAKSTLSLWLRDVGLAKQQKQRLTEKRLKAALRGALFRKNQRLELTEKIKERASKKINHISNRELWLIGTALYWAEGAKQKTTNPSQKVRFSNSDPLMLRLFLKWLTKICKIPNKAIHFEIYIHETANAQNDRKYWSKIFRIPMNQLENVRLKKNKIKTNRKNIGEEYHGLVDIYVRRSTNFNRKIDGWVEGICENCGVVQW